MLPKKLHKQLQDAMNEASKSKDRSKMSLVSALSATLSVLDVLSKDPPKTKTEFKEVNKAIFGSIICILENGGCGKEKKS